MSEQLPSTTTGLDLSSLDALARLADDLEINGLIYANFSGKSGMVEFKDPTGEKQVLQRSPSRHYVINMANIYHGYECWIDGRPQHTLMRRLLDGTKLPAMSELPDHGPYKETPNGKDGWKLVYKVPVYSIQDKADYLIGFSGSAGERGFKDRFIGKVWIPAMKTKLAADLARLPVVTLSGVSKVTNAGYTIHSPVFQVVGWAKEGDYIMAKVPDLSKGREDNSMPAVDMPPSTEASADL